MCSLFIISLIGYKEEPAAVIRLELVDLFCPIHLLFYQDHGSNRDVIISIRRYDETENNCIEETSRCLPSSNVRHNINHDTVSDGNRHDAPPSYSQIPGTVPLHSGRNNGPPPSYDEVIDPHGKY